MKKNFLSALRGMMACALAVCAISCFTACSSDDDDEIVNNGMNVAAAYSGYTTATCPYFTDMVNDGQSVVITANNDGTANVKFDSDTWGNTVLNNVVVTPTATGYQLTGTGETTIAGHGNGGTKTYECQLSGTVGKNKDNAELVFTMPSVMGGLTVKFIQGEAPMALLVSDTYKGYTSTSTAYFSDMITADESVTLKANENGTVSIAFTSAQWGEASIAEAQVTRTDAGFAIAGSGTLSMPGMGGAPAKDYECNVAGTISKDKKEVEITFSVPSVMGGTNIKFILGEAPATEE